jgi:hypothetical protein
MLIKFYLKPAPVRITSEQDLDDKLLRAASIIFRNDNGQGAMIRD